VACATGSRHAGAPCVEVGVGGVRRPLVPVPGEDDSQGRRIRSEQLDVDVHAQILAGRIGPQEAWTAVFPLPGSGKDSASPEWRNDMTMYEIWTFETQPNVKPADLVGYKVEALDGSIGKIDRASADAGSSSIVVDTGPWIFGKKVMLPAGLIDDVDLDAREIFVNRTKDEIKNAPEFDEDRYLDDDYRGDLGTYYGQGGLGFREPGSGPAGADDLR
jgi:hypothetical protein